MGSKTVESPVYWTIGKGNGLECYFTHFTKFQMRNFIALKFDTEDI